MSNLVRNGLIILACLVISTWAVIPPEKKIRLGKDLAGGATLVYQVALRPGEGSEVMEKVKQVIKDRLDPQGILMIEIVSQGADRIEISMPLPNDDVKAARAKVDAALAQLSPPNISLEEFERVAAGPADRRAEWIAAQSRDDAARKGRLEQVFVSYDDLNKARTELASATTEVQKVKDAIRNHASSGENDPIFKGLNDALAAAEAAMREKVNATAQASIAYESTRSLALASGITGPELRRIMLLSDRPLRLPDKTKKMVERPSARAAALADVEKKFPDQKDKVDAAVKEWLDYESHRKSLDDPEDIVRMLKGAGVLNFRIAVGIGEHPQENELRNQLRQGGPTAVKATDARFYRVNKLEAWVQSIEDIDAMRQSSAAYFAQRRLVAEEYKGQPYILLWDRSGMRLTEMDGTWSLTRANPDVDQLGRPAIAFHMDALGASKLGQLTEKNVGNQMAVLLDDEIYTAPTLQSRISSSGQITGSFSQAEIDYITKVLGAGSLKAKLSTEPISRSVTGPQLGADNLRLGMDAGIISFIAVGVFMIGYYFMFGLIAMIGLVFNSLLIVAAMSLSYAPFTLPGIAGIILTFGQAVDANVLVYERMREEFNRGHDMKTAVRLGFSRALSAIVDGNVTTLIVCVVLGLFGTQEIKGFAITLGIGTVTTLIAQLFFVRYLFTLLVDHLGWRKGSMLPMLNDNWLGKRLVPNIDWMSLRFFSYTVTLALVAMGVGLTVWKGKELLGTEFRGGTSVTLVLKETGEKDEKGNPIRAKLERSKVEERVKALAEGRTDTDPLDALRYAEIIAVNPDAGGVVSSTFTVKTLITDPRLVQKVIVQEFQDDIEVRRALAFAGSETEQAGRAGAAFPVTAATLGETIERPNLSKNVEDYRGGLAIVLDKLSPVPAKSELLSRFSHRRDQADFADAAGRRVEIIVLDGTDEQVRSAAVLVADPDISYFNDTRKWETELRDREWELIRTALSQQESLADVQSFSPAVADTFRMDAIWTVTFSTILIIIYIWIRFNSIRYSLAAILTTLHDCICSVGFVAVATLLYQQFPGFSGKLGILPFKIDLNVMAAIMTTLGYSLNDTIIVMDRIRENRGKMPYASRKVINDSINQTISRTLITSGTTVIAVMTLYIVGGEAIRVFSYTMLIGVFVGTFSSIAVAAPLVWVRSADRAGDAEEKALRGGESRAAA